MYRELFAINKSKNTVLVFKNEQDAVDHLLKRYYDITGIESDKSKLRKQFDYSNPTILNFALAFAGGRDSVSASVVSATLIA